MGFSTDVHYERTAGITKTGAWRKSTWGAAKESIEGALAAANSGGTSFGYVAEATLLSEQADGKLRPCFAQLATGDAPATTEIAVGDARCAFSSDVVNVYAMTGTRATATIAAGDNPSSLVLTAAEDGPSELEVALVDGGVGGAALSHDITDAGATTTVNLHLATDDGDIDAGSIVAADDLGGNTAEIDIAAVAHGNSRIRVALVDPGVAGATLGVTVDDDGTDVDVAVQLATDATLDTGTIVASGAGAEITIVAAAPGVSRIRVLLIDPGGALQPLVPFVTDDGINRDFCIYLETDGAGAIVSTVTQVANALNGMAGITATVTAGVGANTAIAVAASALAGGSLDIISTVGDVIVRLGEYSWLLAASLGAVAGTGGLASLAIAVAATALTGGTPAITTTVAALAEYINGNLAHLFTAGTPETPADLCQAVVATALAGGRLRGSSSQKTLTAVTKTGATHSVAFVGAIDVLEGDLVRLDDGWMPYGVLTEAVDTIRRRFGVETAIVNRVRPAMCAHVRSAAIIGYDAVMLPLLTTLGGYALDPIDPHVNTQVRIPHFGFRVD